MTALSKKVAGLERRLRAADLTVAELCRAAPVDPGLWQRWKTGKVAKSRRQTWERVAAAADALLAQQANRAA